MMPHQPFLLKPLANDFKDNPFTSTFPPERTGVLGPLPRLASYVYHCRCLNQTLGIIITTPIILEKYKWEKLSVSSTVQGKRSRLYFGVHLKNEVTDKIAKFTILQV